MRVRICTVLLTILALAATRNVAAGSEPRPFTLVLNGNANPVPTADPCILINTETGTGLATPIGIVKWESREVVNFCANADGAEIDGEFVLTTWSRDQIRGRYHTIARVDPDGAEITAIGRYEITSGTGRLADVTGSGVIAAAGSLAPPFAFNGGLFGRIAF